MRRLVLAVLFTLWWTNPDAWIDGKPICERDRQELVTLIYNGPTPNGPWEFYGWTQYGEDSYESTPGRHEWYNAQSELYGVVGPWWDAVRRQDAETR